jgi:hypothetical protein
MPEGLTCTPKRLPRDLWISAAKTAVDINPVNHPPLHRLLSVMSSFSLRPERIYPKPDAQAAAVAPGIDAGELARLREEPDGLKKALAIFARDR